MALVMEKPIDHRMMGHTVKNQMIILKVKEGNKKNLIARTNYQAGKCDGDNPLSFIFSKKPIV
jgi:hypothetical protein